MAVDFGDFWALFLGVVVFSPFFAPSGRKCALGGNCFIFGQRQIHQTEQAVDLGGVLR